MYSKLMQHFKNTIWSLLIATVVVVGGYSGYVIYADTIKEYTDSFANSSDSFETVKRNYHNTMNDYFNEKVDLFLKLIKTKNYVNSPDFKSDGECTETNVSSYCVSMGALDLYMKYVQTLLEIRSKLPKVDNSSKLNSIFSDVSLRDAKIEKEIDDAQLVMEEAMKVYDEYKTAYPMHLEYENIIKSLNKFKVAIKNVREEVEKFPGKFIDATSPTCK